ncbi:hypothetical protein BC830DRAFT_1127464 [Chytriomyces sp. MP71]|nr:hypothetical protein BC830DRAFT_1127464 [Chytriomyces sp. MP71]
MAHMSQQRRTLPTLAIPVPQVLCTRAVLQEEVQVLHSPTNWMHAFSGASKEPETFFSMSPAEDDNCKTPTLLSARSKTPPAAIQPPTPKRRPSFMVGGSEHDSLSSAIAAIMSSSELKVGGTRRWKCDTRNGHPRRSVTPVLLDVNEAGKGLLSGCCATRSQCCVSPVITRSLPNSPASMSVPVSRRTSLDTLASQPAGKLTFSTEPVQKGRFTVRRL